MYGMCLYTLSTALSNLSTPCSASPRDCLYCLLRHTPSNMSTAVPALGRSNHIAQYTGLPAELHTPRVPMHVH
jgi:hypothetical protein